MENKPSLNKIEAQEFEELVFARTQTIQQRPGESSEAVHERLRPYVLSRFNTIKEATHITTPSWYTFDLSHIGIPDAVAVCTSTCKHETPFLIFVGTRQKDWRTILTQASALNQGNERFRCTLFPLGRELSDEEKTRYMILCNINF